MSGSCPLWQPDAERIGRANVTRFAHAASALAGKPLHDHAALHRWSVDNPEAFWDLLWDRAGVRATCKGDRVLDNREAMPGARFFPDARLNFAENLLRRDDDTDALVYRCEDLPPERLSWRQLRLQVAALAAHLKGHGIGPGDVVAGFLPNCPAAIIGMLATSSLGAAWTSCSPDFGTRGVLDRFGQVAPRALICADGYRYKGKAIDSLERVRRIVRELPSLCSTIVAPNLGPAAGGVDLSDAVGLAEVLTEYSDTELEFEAVQFNAPLYVLYSSGTTGAPKCIVHSVGGTLLKHLAEHQLMCDVRPGDRVFYFTTCGWMMWNWLASALASEATLLLYDGNPAYPELTSLFEYAAAERCTLFGTSAKFIDALAKGDARPAADHDLSNLRTITSTGSPLSPAGFEYVYEAVHPDICLSSISGGTDIVGCFVGGDPTGAVWAGEIQAPALGMAIDVVDDAGRSLPRGKGELVCRAPFPSMPIGFWNDDDGRRYRAAYFERFPGVWHQGDYAEFTEHGGVVIHGRSDATLNPGGVRIGTAEIYRVVEGLAEVAEAIAVGQEWQDDVRVVLFVRLAAGHQLDDEFRQRLRKEIRTHCSPRHVPARIAAVADIPRTKSGKIVELAVRETIHGRPVANTEALANPEALRHFADRPELRE